MSNVTGGNSWRIMARSPGDLAENLGVSVPALYRWLPGRGEDLSQ
jgi:hypothetical protein